MERNGEDGHGGGCTEPTVDIASSRANGHATLYTTGDMARLSNSTLRTVRFYEQEGLIQPVSRSEGGHRYFSADDLQKLQLALDLREAGLSLQAIKALYELKREAKSPEEASRHMSDVLESQISDMQRKIIKLRRLREELVSMVSVISECRDCQDQTFPVRCRDCEVLKRPELPRAVRVLWTE
jgi:DNA-binding transcriptional MerR regulator